MSVSSYGDAGVASERQGSLAGGCGTSNAQPPTTGKVAPSAMLVDKAQRPRNLINRSLRSAAILSLSALNSGNIRLFQTSSVGTRRVFRSNSCDQSST